MHTLHTSWPAGGSGAAARQTQIINDPNFMSRAAACLESANTGIVEAAAAALAALTNNNKEASLLLLLRHKGVSLLPWACWRAFQIEGTQHNWA